MRLTDEQQRLASINIQRLTEYKREQAERRALAISLEEARNSEQAERTAQGGSTGATADAGGLPAPPAEAGTAAQPARRRTHRGRRQTVVSILDFSI